MKFAQLTTEAEIRKLIAFHNECSEFVTLDTETTDKDPRKAKLLDIQISGYVEDEAFMFGAEFAPLLLELNKPFVFWNMKYDVKVLYRHGVDIRGKEIVDPMLIDHLVDENRDHDLDSHVQELFNDDYKERFWAEYDNYSDAPLDRRIDYGCRDIVYTGRVYNHLRRQFDAQGLSLDLIKHVHRLGRALLNTEIQGIAIDLGYVTEMGSQLKTDIVKTERELREMGGAHCEAIELDQWVKEIEKYKTDKKRQSIEKPEFNFQASGQVATLLYDRLNLPVQINPKTRARTADDKALEKLEDEHPIIPKIRQLRKYSKMYGAFVEGILDRADCGRIYPSFNVNGTATGRISHSDPNMGQMPSKGDWVKIRGIFVPDEGKVLGTADYGQIEVCISAHYSQDPNLLKIILEGASKHDLTSEGLKIPRPLAKTLNFGMQYLCGPDKVAKVIGCSKAQGLEIWQQYWNTYAGEKRVIDECIAKLEGGEPIVNPFGRKRRFPDYKRSGWANPAKGQFDSEMRQAYNALIQGTASDITSRAFYLFSEFIKNEGWGRTWFSLHDEIIYEVDPERFEDARNTLVSIMTEVGKEINLTVPLTVDASDALQRWAK